MQMDFHDCLSENLPHEVVIISNFLEKLSLFHHFPVFKIEINGPTTGRVFRHSTARFLPPSDPNLENKPCGDNFSYRVKFGNYLHKIMNNE